MMQVSFDDLKGKVCVITGGGGVIGQSLIRGLASCGVNIVLLDRMIDHCKPFIEELQNKYGVKAVALVADVLDKKSLEQVRITASQTMGATDILINCAGGNNPKATTKIERMDKDSLGKLEDTFFGLEMEGFRQVFDLNFLGTLLPTMVFAQDMLKKGKGTILNISSMNSFKPLTKIPAYSAAKAAINNFTEWLSTHLAKMNIRVNAIAPGFFLTNQNRFLLTDEKTGALTKRGQTIIDRTPMSRFGEPEDLCGTCNFLVSDASSFITGVVIPVDGGFNAYSGV